MIRLSVNVNKIATLRNSRGGELPDVVHAARLCVAAGAAGITVHPRADQRHIRPGDVHALQSAFANDWGERLEYNIEGDPRPDWLDLVRAVRPQQATLVPVRPGEVTSEAGWDSTTDLVELRAIVRRLQAQKIRVSVFIDAQLSAVELAQSVGADRVELYTEPFADAFVEGGDTLRNSFDRYCEVARAAHALGLGINAGHDLNLENLRVFRTLPYLDEVSIGHALISHALDVGMTAAVKDYLAALTGAALTGTAPAGK